MKLNCGLPKELALVAKARRLRDVWQKCFILLPIRVSDTECRWLEVAEMRYPHAVVNYWGDLRTGHKIYRFKDDPNFGKST